MLRSLRLNHRLMWHLWTLNSQHLLVTPLLLINVHSFQKYIPSKYNPTSDYNSNKTCLLVQFSCGVVISRRQSWQIRKPSVWHFAIKTLQWNQCSWKTFGGGKKNPCSRSSALFLTSSSTFTSLHSFFIMSLQETVELHPINCHLWLVITISV